MNCLVSRFIIYPSFMVGIVVALAVGQSTIALAEDYNNMSTEERVSRLEKINDGRNDLQITQTLDALQQEIQSLRGQLELYERQITTLTKQQQDYYRDLDDRIRKLQGTTVATTATAPTVAASTSVSSGTESISPVSDPALAPTAPLENTLGPTAANFNSPQGNADLSSHNNTSLQNTSTITTTAATNTQVVTASDNQEAYLAAYQLVVNRRFSDAQIALQQYINQYPNGVYVPNAYYWLGEVHLTQKQLPEAEQAFKAVVERFPNHNKTPDALLKLGYTYVAEGNKQLARETFLQVKSRYSHLAVAQLADAQLAQLGP